MTILIAIAIALMILFGALALPYSVILTTICWVLAVGGLVVVAVRQREHLRMLLILTPVLCILGVLIWNVILMPWVNVEVVSGITPFNPDGREGYAFVVYHPGQSDLQTHAVNGFVEGLVQSDWRVDLTTASAQTPTNLAAYDLLVLGAQSYTWSPARPIQSYLARVGDLNGMPVVAILSGLGETGPANTVMRELVSGANGTLMTLHNVWQLRPIDDLYGTDDPFEAMRGVAQTLQLTNNE